jgi:hypothetical protein
MAPCLYTAASKEQDESVLIAKPRRLLERRQQHHTMSMLEGECSVNIWVMSILFAFHQVPSDYIGNATCWSACDNGNFGDNIDDGTGHDGDDDKEKEMLLSQVMPREQEEKAYMVCWRDWIFPSLQLQCMSRGWLLSLPYWQFTRAMPFTSWSGQDLRACIYQVLEEVIQKNDWINHAYCILFTVYGNRLTTEVAVHKGVIPT